MTFGERLSTRRKQAGYTQEQLAELLGVSRQAVGKWETDLAFPETEKLIRLSELYACSLDELVKGESEMAERDRATGSRRWIGLPSFEYTSEKRLGGLPLVHVVFGKGKAAKGIIAVGFVARGIVSVGFLSLGVLSLGFASLGVFAFGLLALGLVAFGTFALGLIALGAISCGVLSFGAIAVGDGALGALAFGRSFAIGDRAYATHLAIGQSFSSAKYALPLPVTDQGVLEEALQKLPALYQTIVRLFVG
ncbi:MAG: helix-turn-helix domain-containing protein [Christensenellaceae bacterium]